MEMQSTARPLLDDPSSSAVAVHNQKATARTYDIGFGPAPVKWRKSQAGIHEARWARANPAALAAYRGKWVAILGNEIVAHASTAPEVYKTLTDAGWAYALVRRVPEKKRPRLIA